MKYALPTDDGKTVSKVFGRAKRFALYDDSNSSYLIVQNDGAGAEHGAGTGAAAFLADKGVDILIAPEVGPNAAEALHTAGIRVKSTESGRELGEAMADCILPAL
jgi:predicted Fe-Mo cluster-binding NifX family protein